MLMQDCGWVRALTPTHVRMHLRLVTYIVRIRAREEKKQLWKVVQIIGYHYMHTFKCYQFSFFIIFLNLFLH